MAGSEYIPIDAKELGLTLGYSATVDDVTDDEPERVISICLNLTEGGLNALEQALIVLVLDAQRKVARQNKLDGTTNPVKASQELQEALYEVQMAKKCQDIQGGSFTLRPDDHCPDIKVVDFTELAGYTEPDGSDLCGLPDTTGLSEAKLKLLQWLLVDTSDGSAFARAIQRLIDDKFLKLPSTTPPYGPGNGGPPGTGTGSNGDDGSGDSGAGGSEWTDETGGVITVCFNPPILLGGPEWGDIPTQILAGQGIVALSHTYNFTEKIRDAVHLAFGPWGKMFRFKRCQISFDGVDVNHILYHIPFVGDIGVDVFGILHPKILWNSADGASHDATIEPTYTDLAAIIKGKVGGVDDTLAELTCDEWVEEGIWIGAATLDNPNSGHFIRCNNIGAGYTLNVCPPYAIFEDGVLHADHTGLRFFLECVTMHPPTEYEVTMPFTSTAGVASAAQLTTGQISATYPSNGWSDVNLLDYGAGFKAWYCTTNQGHGQVFLPENESCSKIIFDVTISNPDGVTDADWDCRVWTSENYGQDTFLASCPTQHNHNSGSHTDTSTHHIEVDLGGTHDYCTPFYIQVFGGIILLEAQISYA